MKFLIASILLALVPACIPSPCKIFRCGNIKQVDGEDLKCIDPTTDTIYDSEKCGANQHCESFKWIDVTEAGTARCKANEGQEVANTAAPGDYCSDVQYCFGFAEQHTCVNNVCVSNRNEGGACPNDGALPGHKWCSLGHYCTNQLCAKQVGKGEACTVGEQCHFGLACVATNTEFNDFKCQELHKLGNNLQFDISRYLHGGNIWVGYNSFCASNHAIDVAGQLTRKECRQGDRSINMTSLNDYRRDGDGGECHYDTFSSASDNEFESTMDRSFCGFNTVTNGYCMIRKGDDWFLDQHKAYIAQDLSQLNCHPQTSIRNCSSFMNMNEDVRINWNRANLAVDETFGYPLYAKNDRCVAETITPAFWQGREPDSAVSTAVWSAFTLAIIAVFYLV